MLEVLWEPGAATAAKKLTGDDLGIAGVVTRGGTVEHTQANGAKVRRERRTGDVLWEKSTAQIEALQNVGSGNMNILQVRLKKAAPTGKYTGAVTGVKKVLDHPPLAAFDQMLAPGSKLPLHRYAPRLWVVLEGGHLRSTTKDGKKKEALVRTAQVLWLDAAEQVLENVGSTPVRAISFELK